MAGANLLARTVSGVQRIRSYCRRQRGGFLGLGFKASGLGFVGLGLRGWVLEV